MTIPVTTRGGKGSALTQSEMDTNLTNLARDASTTQQGNTRLATDAEAIAGSLDSVAVTPASLAAAIGGGNHDFVGTKGYIELRDKFVLQWAQVNAGDFFPDQQTVVTWATAFATPILAWASVHYDSVPPSNAFAGTTNLTTTGVTVVENETAANAQDARINVFALGLLP